MVSPETLRAPTERLTQPSHGGRKFHEQAPGPLERTLYSPGTREAHPCLLTSCLLLLLHDAIRKVEGGLLRQRCEVSLADTGRKVLVHTRHRLATPPGEGHGLASSTWVLRWVIDSLYLHVPLCCQGRQEPFRIGTDGLFPQRAFKNKSMDV